MDKKQLRLLIDLLPRLRDVGSNIGSHHQYCLCVQPGVGSLERMRWTAYEKLKRFEKELLLLSVTNVLTI